MHRRLSDLPEPPPGAILEAQSRPTSGAPLRPVADRLESRKLVTGSDADTVIGGQLNLWVKTPDSANTLESCVWTSPDGATYVVDNQTVTSKGLRADNVNGEGSDSKICHLKINSLSRSQLGTWRCRIVFAGSNQFHDAFFTATTEIRVSDVRLPLHLLPDKYNVFLTPYLVENNFTIQGHVDIEMKVVLGNSNNITLHIQDMTIFENTVQVIDNVTNQNLVITGFGYDNPRGFLIIYLRDGLTQGQSLRLKIDFIGNLNDDLSGFYRSSYFDKTTNRTEYIATTQFEATYARRAMPCFDEPAMKAKFQINLGRTKDRTSISNMPIEYEGVPMADNDEYVWDQYKESLSMSTYLLAFVVSRFTYRQSQPRPNGVQFRIWSRNEAFDQTEYAADVGPKVLEFFENYYKIKFPLPKQDMIAIPDFSAGAMENWGLITYREVALLYEPGKSSLSDREYVATVIAHELAHQWFGDLVTMEWWTDLWLNEGFASYMEYFGASHVEQDTGLQDRFPLESMHGTFRADSLQTSHPISVPVNHPDEINEIFDSISYGKGASVIRMMANFLGLDTFNAGITDYLNLHKYQNAKQDDLWTALTERGHQSRNLDDTQSVKEVMDTWTLQMGYPVVKVDRTYTGSPNEEVTLSQERFLLYRDKEIVDNHEYRWWIPISFTTSGGGFNETKNSIWLSPTETKAKKIFANVNQEQAVIVNIQQTGFYRVNYDTKNWDLIRRQLLSDHHQIHRINRGQILDDALNLARAGYLDYQTALGMTEYLVKEDEYIPWSAAITAFSYLELMLGRSGGFGAFKNYLISELLPIFNRLGVETKSNDTFLDILLRESVVKIICRLGFEKCETEAQAYLQALMLSQGKPISGDLPNYLRQTIFCTAISLGDEKEWDFLFQYYLKSNNANEKSNILKALACSKDMWVLQRYLDMSIDPNSGIRKQDGSSVITSIAGNRAGHFLVWNWLRSRWADVSEYFDTAISSSVGKMISSCAQDFNTELELKELEDFYNDHLSELGTAKRDTEIAIQNTKANIKWMKTNYAQITTWLKTAKPNV